MTELNGFLPPHWSRNNPIDILGDAGPDRYAKALEIAGRDPDSDGLLVILTPQDMTDATRTADALKPYAHVEGKPVIASWMGGPDVEAGVNVLNQCGIPTFAYPDTAARAFTYMWRYTQNLKSLYETPALDEEAEENPPDRAEAARIIDEVRASRREILTEFESKRLLAAYRIPTVPTEIATDERQAVEIAGRIGYPVVLKLHSLTITHKTDVGGIKLNLPDADAVAAAFQRHPRVRRRKGRRRALPRRHRAADGEAERRLRADRRQQHRPAVRPVLLFGPAGSSSKSSRTARSLAAAHAHARVPAHGADEDPHGAEGRARPPARSTSPRSSGCSCGSASSSSSSRGFARSTSTRCWPRPSG
jgi:acyl-CoA synthetase (NDP forming)